MRLRGQFPSIAAVALLLVALSVSAGVPRLAAAGQDVPARGTALPADLLPVPDWLAWTVLYDSLTFYRGRAAADVEAMLHVRAGLGPSQARTLFATGAAFVAAIAEIEAAAVAEVQARYGRERPRTRADLPPRPPARVEVPPGAPPAGRPVMHESGTALVDLLQASGEYAGVEARKDAALTAHLQQLTRALGGPAVTRLTALVQTTVRPTIVRGVVRRPVPPLRELPPGVTATGTSQPPAPAR